MSHRLFVTLLVLAAAWGAVVLIFTAIEPAPSAHTPRTGYVFMRDSGGQIRQIPDPDMPGVLVMGWTPVTWEDVAEIDASAASAAEVWWILAIAMAVAPLGGLLALRAWWTWLRGPSSIKALVPVLLFAILATACSGQDLGRSAKFQAASDWCAAKSKQDATEMVLWLCHDDAPLVTVCAPPPSLDRSPSDPCAEIMVQP